MHRLVQRNSQFIIATHSPILLGYPGATIYLFAEKNLTRTAYLDTEHYQITKAFLDRPERMLNELFRGDDPPQAWRRRATNRATIPSRCSAFPLNSAN